MRVQWCLLDLAMVGNLSRQLATMEEHTRTIEVNLAMLKVRYSS